MGRHHPKASVLAADALGVWEHAKKITRPAARLLQAAGLFFSDVSGAVACTGAATLSLLPAMR